jgi:hypothetical protein
MSLATAEQGQHPGREAGPATLCIALERLRNWFVGTAVTPTSGAARVAVDVAAADDVIGDHALTVMAPRAAGVTGWRPRSGRF